MAVPTPRSAPINTNADTITNNPVENLANVKRELSPINNTTVTSMNHSHSQNSNNANKNANTEIEQLKSKQLVK